MPIYLTGWVFTPYFCTRQKKDDSENSYAGSSLQHFQPHFFLLKWSGDTLSGFIKYNPQNFIAFCHWLKHHEQWAKKPLCIHRLTKSMGTDLPSAFSRRVMFLTLAFHVQIANLSPFWTDFFKVTMKSRQGCHKMHTILFHCKLMKKSFIPFYPLTSGILCQLAETHPRICHRNLTPYYCYNWYTPFINFTEDIAKQQKIFRLNKIWPVPIAWEDSDSCEL